MPRTHQRRAKQHRAAAERGIVGNTGPQDAGARGESVEAIALAALDLARRAHAAGFAAIGHLLEIAALEASAEAAVRRWPSES